MSFEFDNDFRTDDEGMGLDGAAVARITGRVARVDPVGDDAAKVVMWVIAEDEGTGHDDSPQETRYQAIRIYALPSQLWRLSDSCEVEVLCRFSRGQLWLSSLESVREDDSPLPTCKVPARKLAAGDAANAELPTMDQLDNLSREGEWGRLNHSIYRFAVPVHIVFCPKYRRQALLGREIEAQALLRHVIREEGLEAIACAVEHGDHVHLVVRHPGAGTPPTFCWAKFVGRIKALTSRLFKQFDPEFEWQVGYSLTAVHGGRQSAEQALAAVRAYVENQGVQGEAGHLDGP